MTDAPEGLIFLPLGGSGEIGMNFNLYGHGGQWLVVDLGVSFGDDTMPGVEVFMGDPEFIAQRREKLLGIVLTHAHEDHLGAVSHLWPRLRCPVYATPFAAALLRHKLGEANLLGEVEVREIPQGTRFRLGPFDIELVTVTHSLPEPNALALRTPEGLIVHTGDWKLDPAPITGPRADLAAMARLGAEGVRAVVGDSTNIFVRGSSGSESAVREHLIEMFGRFRGRIAVACFATNVARLGSIAAAAGAHGREVALVGRSLERIDSIARSLGFLDGAPSFVDVEEAAYLPRESVVYLCTGSQGEPRAALSRIAAGDHPQVRLQAGDAAIFSSRIIPGNERAIHRLHDQLVRQGVEVVTEKAEFVHVSGHPARDEIAELYRLLKPRLVVPVHGERRHLEEHARFARELGVPETVVIENGDMLRLAPGAPEIVDRVPTGRLGVDGLRLRPLDSSVFQARRRMARDGGAVVTLVLDAGGRMVAPPQVAALGLVDGADDDATRAALVTAVREAIEGMAPESLRDDETVREAARLSVRRHLGAEMGKRPRTEVHLVRV